MFARMRAGIEAAAPFPRIGVGPIADPLGNPPDMNIAVVNVPALSVMFGSAASEFGHGPLLLRLARVWSGGPRALHDIHLLNNAGKVRNRLFVDGRRLRFAGLLNLRQVSTGQDCQETGCHTPSKPPCTGRQSPTAWALEHVRAAAACGDQNLLFSRSAANCASASDAKSSGVTTLNHRLATGPPSPRRGENGRAPVPRFAQVRDNRKLRDIRHCSPRRTDSRQPCAMPTGLLTVAGGLPMRLIGVAGART